MPHFLNLTLELANVAAIVYQLLFIYLSFYYIVGQSDRLGGF